MTYRNTLLSISFSNDKIPAFIEPRKNAKLPYVKYGESNNYPEFLVTLFNRSAKHNSIVTSKQLYINGRGWQIKSEGLTPDQQVKLQGFVDNVNQFESLKELSEKTSLDCEIFGGFYLKVIKNRKGEVSELYHVNYCSVRSNTDNSEFYISDNWIDDAGNERTALKEDEFKIIPAYVPDKKQPESIYYYKSYRPNLKTYTLPEYIGAIPAIITDAEIANFHRAEIQNSFKGSKMIVFKNGVPSPEEMKKTKRQIEQQFKPTDKAGDILVDFVDDPNRVPEILDLQAGDFAAKYEALNKTIQEEIFVGHKVTSPMLFGVRTEGQLGGRNEMIEAFNLFQNTYISPKQQVQEGVYNYFAPIKNRLSIQPLEPVMPTFSETVLATILTKDEMREIIGRKPLEIQTEINNNIVDSINALSPLVANKVLSYLTPNDIRGIINKPPIEGGDVINTTSQQNMNLDFKAQEFKPDDDLDYSVFSKYGEPAENFESIRVNRQIFSQHEEFKLEKLENAVLDLIKKTPNITIDELQKVLKENKTKISNAIKTLVNDGYITDTQGKLLITSIGSRIKIPTFDELYVRYRYILRPDAPPLISGGQSRPFCKAMMANPRYYSKKDIDRISKELAIAYGITGYDAFRRRGGWYHDPTQDVNVPYCRHIWQQELVKRVKK